MSTFALIAKLAFTVLTLVLSTHPSIAGDDPANAGLPEWMGKARIAGAEVFAGMPDAEVAVILDRLVAQNVSVVEADSDLSHYLTDKELANELSFIESFVRAAHQRGLRVVWYYPVLEVLSKGAKAGGRSMYRDHPDWVQQGLGHKSSVFYGGDGRIHWVEKDMESAWMTIQSPYADYLLNRLKKISKTGVDGLWLDVPLLSDIETQWADMNPYATAKFKADTGLDAPKEEDWDNPGWRRWIAWRYSETTNFLKRIVADIRDNAPESVVVVENVTIDNNNNTRLALDGTTMKAFKHTIQAWEIDAVSDSLAMENAKLDDWHAFILMNKFAKAASGAKPSWVFSYGYGVKDSELVQAIGLATGNHPYETKIPEMATTVDGAFRSRSYSWVKTNLPQLFQSEPAVSVGVLFSGHSRDYLDRARGSGLYATWQSDDPLWWTKEVQDSVYWQTYLAEYRGIAKWLSQSHIPFEIIVSPEQAELERYQVVIAPALTAIAADEFRTLRRYAENGGQVIITGVSPLSRNEIGDPQQPTALLGSDMPTPEQPDAARVLALGEGVLIFVEQYIGGDYIKNGTKHPIETLRGLLEKLERPVQVTSDAQIHVELRQHQETTLLHLINVPDQNGVSGLQAAGVSVDWRLPKSSCQPHISRTALTEEEKDVDFLRTGNTLRFTVQIERHVMLRLECGVAGMQRANDPPIAEDDALTAVVDRPLLIRPSDLTANDGDLDKDPLEIRIVLPESGFRGTLNPIADASGTWQYTPAKGFVGVETLEYEVDDRHGGKDRAVITIDVGPEYLVAYPGRLEVEIGEADSTALTNLTEIDDKTLDIEAAPRQLYLVTSWVVHTPVPKPSDVEELVFVYSGQFSYDGVVQSISIYNHASQEWDLIDSREIGTGDDVVIRASIKSELDAYIGGDGNVRVRFYAHRHGSPFSQWANAMNWSVIKKN
jgi:uncharacterized lipoprotein YddW (UPF0748 family)